jgi:uncharacterized protein (TIGR02118 family)
MPALAKWLFALAAGSGLARACSAARRSVFVAEPTNALLAEQAGRTPKAQRLDGVLAAWWESDEAQRLPDAHAYRVEEVLHWDDAPPGAASAADLAAGIAVLYFVRRREDLSQAEFVARYRDGHAPLARVHHPGIRRYVQNFVLEAEPGAPAWNAVSELHFASESDFRERFYRDPGSPAIVARDVLRFTDPKTGFALVTRQRVLAAV